MHPHIWYPYTQAKTAPEPLKVQSAQGIWLELADGRRIIDCISSWWVNLYGHAHPKIAEAIYQQAQQLEQVIFAGFTHAPAEQLAERLVQILPQRLTRVFYSDNGSTAVEVALKMAYQYWSNLDQKRSTFLAFEGAYHGDTFGAMAMGRSLFTHAFDDLLFDVEYLPFPETYWNDQTVIEREQHILHLLKEKLHQGGDRYAALLLEPLVQGAGGMRMCRPEFLQSLQEVLRSFDVLFIADEVMTGFGRTGDRFACLRAGISPDMICLSKGLTGGFLPMSLTVCTEQIYQAFYSDDPMKTLYHGHSYAANPLGCAAALASLDLLMEYEPAFQAMEMKHWEFLKQFQSYSQLEKIRVTGTIAAMDLVTPEQTGYLNQITMTIRQRAIEAGLLLRPLGNVLYLMLPYCTTDEELALVYQGVEQVLSQVL
jgi:adenosylmethionine---8-amino-7-oxononanoate aminotransferase